MRGNDSRGLKKFVFNNLPESKIKSDPNYGMIFGDNKVNFRRGPWLTQQHTLRYINTVSEV